MKNWMLFYMAMLFAAYAGVASTTLQEKVDLVRREGGFPFLVAKANLLSVHTNETIFGSDWAMYDLVEIGKGNGKLGASRVFFNHRPGLPELPVRAVLVANEPIMERTQAFYTVRGDEIEYGIFPFSEELWQELIGKSNAELRDAPESEWSDPEDAIRALLEYLEQMQGVPKYVYLQPPRRASYGWSLTAIYAVGKELGLRHAKISDKGSFQVLPDPPIIRLPQEYYPSGNWTDESIEQAVSYYYHDAHPRVWPYRVDAETGKPWQPAP